MAKQKKNDDMTNGEKANVIDSNTVKKEKGQASLSPEQKKAKDIRTSQLLEVLKEA